MGFPEMLVALHNKAIDAAINNKPTITLAEEEGVAVRASKDVIYPGQQTAVVLYSEKFAQERRPVAEKFMNAYIRAVRDYNNAIHGGRLASTTPTTSSPSSPNTPVSRTAASTRKWCHSP